MLAEEIMTSNPITISQDKLVQDAADLMLEKNFSVLPIVDSDSKLVGIITESDFVGKEVNVPHALVSIRQLFGKSFRSANVEDICDEARTKKLFEVMTKNPVTVTKKTSLTEIVQLMQSKNLKRIPVIEGDAIVGIITRKDLIKAFGRSK